MGARFSAPVHTGHGDHPASYTMGTGSVPGVKRPGRGVKHPPPCSAEVKERVQLSLLPLWAFVARYRVTFTFTFYSNNAKTFTANRRRTAVSILSLYRDISRNTADYENHKTGARRATNDM